MTADTQLRLIPGSLDQVGNQDGGQGPAGSHGFGGKISCGLKYFWPGLLVWVVIFLFLAITLCGFQYFYFLVFMVPVESRRFWP